MANKIICRPLGIWKLVVCAPKAMSAKRVCRAANLHTPAGIHSRWEVSKVRKLADGTRLPAPCLDDKSRRHWLLEC